MPFKLIAPITQTFVLTDIDEKYGNDGDATTITVRQAAQREQERRENLFNEIVRETRPDSESTRFVFRYPVSQLRKMEAYLTLSDCNILGINGKPLFRFSQEGKIVGTLEQFSENWGLLPSDICDEIHRCVIKVNPDWKTGDEGENLGE